MAEQSPTLLLENSIYTDPDPLKASSANSLEEGTIYLTVKASPDTFCEFIAFEIPVGDAATDLFLTDPKPTAKCSNTDWEPSPDNIPETTNPPNTKNFTFRNDNDGIVDSDVTFQITGTVNKSTGVSTIKITEFTFGPDDDDYTPKDIPKDITKVSEGLFLKNLVIVNDNTLGKPATIIDNNGAAQLQWESNGAAFRVYFGSGSEPLENAKQYKMDKGLATDTIFVVEATLNGNTLHQGYAALANTPDAAFNSLSAKTVDFTGAGVKMLNSTTNYTQTAKMSASSFIASSDGFVIGRVYPFLPATPAEPQSTGTPTLATITTDIGIFPASTTLVSPIGTNFGSTTVPIRKGEKFSICCKGTYAFPALTTMFYWIGLGAGIPEATTSIEEHSKMTEDYLEEMQSSHKIAVQKATAFITALESAFDITLADTARDQLVEQFL